MGSFHLFFDISILSQTANELNSEWNLHHDGTMRVEHC